MKLNQDNLKFGIKRILRDYQMSGRDSAARKIAKYIMDEIESDMNKEWNLAHDFPIELDGIVKRFEKGLSLNLFKRTPEAIKVYQWVAEQEANGQKIEAFCKWAMHPDRIKFVGKYRAKPENIIADWPQAFVQLQTSSRPKAELL